MQGGSKSFIKSNCATTAPHPPHKNGGFFMPYLRSIAQNLRS